MTSDPSLKAASSEWAAKMNSNPDFLFGLHVDSLALAYERFVYAYGCKPDIDGEFATAEGSPRSYAQELFGIPRDEFNLICGKEYLSAASEENINDKMILWHTLRNTYPEVDRVRSFIGSTNLDSNRRGHTKRILEIPCVVEGKRLRDEINNSSDVPIDGHIKRSSYSNIGLWTRKNRDTYVAYVENGLHPQYAAAWTTVMLYNGTFRDRYDPFITINSEGENIALHWELFSSSDDGDGLLWIKNGFYPAESRSMIKVGVTDPANAAKIRDGSPGKWLSSWNSFDPGRNRKPDATI